MAEYESKKRWKAENTKNLVVNINRNTDKEIFDWLEGLNEPYGKLVKAAIKEYIANHSSAAQPAEEEEDDDDWLEEYMNAISPNHPDNVKKIN
jgi:hypothetical protein